MFIWSHRCCSIMIHMHSQCILLVSELAPSGPTAYVHLALLQYADDRRTIAATLGYLALLSLSFSAQQNACVFVERRAPRKDGGECLVAQPTHL